MTNQELYNTIFKRKSIRKYDMTPLAYKTLNGIKEYVNLIKPLDKNIKYSFSYLGENDVKAMLYTQIAPHYICLYSEKKDGYLMNAGYLLQQVDLYLSASSIGSCWLGLTKPTKEVLVQENELEFVIMLAFGNAAETEQIHRKSTSEFKRKSISDITSIPGAEQLLEPVRLAPSAVNSQPWFFSGNMHEILVSRQKLNIIKAQLMAKNNQIDIGIALFHLWLSLDNEGKTAIYNFDIADVPKGYEFMVKVNVVDK